MDKQIYYTKLYDLYYKLLTNKQMNFFELYYFENLTLDEIAKISKITKSGVSKQIKTVETILSEYENKLCLLKKLEKMEETFKNDLTTLKKIQKIWED